MGSSTVQKGSTARGFIVGGIRPQSFNRVRRGVHRDIGTFKKAQQSKERAFAVQKGPIEGKQRGSMGGHRAAQRRGLRSSEGRGGGGAMVTSIHEIHRGPERKSEGP